MYRYLKRIASQVIPQKILSENEFLIRKMMTIFYRGKNCKCNLCNTNLRTFAILKNGEKLCPICGSLARIRRLYHIIENEFLKENIRILDFSPLKIQYKRLKENNKVDYISTDFENEFIADYKYDIRAIDASDSSYDLIICYHILEHIIEDVQAMSELYRVLKTNGKVLIQTPFKSGEIYEDYTIMSPTEREKHFGQHDHVRIYSVSGLNERLQKVGFTTEIRTMKGNDYFGFAENETVIICYK